MTINKKGWEAVVANNLTGGFLVARETFNQSMRKHGGAIVNIVADMWGGMPGMGHSGAARAGMVNFTETASVEWASFGVRVNAIAPGVIRTAMWERDVARGVLDEAQYLEAVPLHRLGDPAEVGKLAVFLASDESSYITGAVHTIDGALTSIPAG
jgi:citronellol/citronellal dehydrogenase